MTEAEVTELSKEVCWYDGGGPKCKMDCKNCEAGHFKKWKWIIRLVIPKWEDMKNGRGRKI